MRDVIANYASQPKKLILVFCLFLSTLFLFGCFNQEQLPIRRLTITIEPSQRKELFSQLQKFAEKHGFEYMTSDYGTGGERFIVELLNEQIKILVVDVPEAPSLVSVRFYDQTLANPVSQETLEIIDGLLIELESFISEIPSVTVTEE